MTSITRALDEILLDLTAEAERLQRQLNDETMRKVETLVRAATDPTKKEPDLQLLTRAEELGPHSVLEQFEVDVAVRVQLTHSLRVSVQADVINLGFDHRYARTKTQRNRIHVCVKQCPPNARIEPNVSK